MVYSWLVSEGEDGVIVPKVHSTSIKTRSGRKLKPPVLRKDLNRILRSLETSMLVHRSYDDSDGAITWFVHERVQPVTEPEKFDDNPNQETALKAFSGSITFQINMPSTEMFWYSIETTCSRASRVV